MSDHLIPDTICPSCSGTGKIVDLEKELFGQSDEVIIAENMSKDQIKWIELNREIKELKDQVKRQDKESRNIWSRYHKCRDVIAFLVKDGEQRISEALYDD